MVGILKIKLSVPLRITQLMQHILHVRQRVSIYDDRPVHLAKIDTKSQIPITFPTNNQWGHPL